MSLPQPPSQYHGSVLGDITNSMVQQAMQVGYLVGREKPPHAHVPTQTQLQAQPAGGGAACCDLTQVSFPKTVPQTLAQRQEVAHHVEVSGDPQLATEYVSDIYARLFETEVHYLAKPDYMAGQEDINGKMRAILIDWLVEVHMKYRLRPETLFLAVSIIDRFLSVRPVLRKKLQLLGVVAMFVAAKFEEIDPPKAHEFAYITDHTYSKKEIVNMECAVLVALDCRLTGPTPVHFLDMLQSINGCTAAQRSLAQYALELAMLDLRSLKHPPSVLASAALLMSNDFFGKQPAWPLAMSQHSRRSEESLRACAADLRLLLETAKTASLQAMRRKYQLDVNNAVAKMSPSAVQSKSAVSPH